MWRQIDFELRYFGRRGGNDILLTVLIPEPTSLALLALSALGLLRRRRCQA